jgi:hypothetical protein
MAYILGAIPMQAVEKTCATDKKGVVDPKVASDPVDVVKKVDQEEDATLIEVGKVFTEMTAPPSVLELNALLNRVHSIGAMEVHALDASMRLTAGHSVRPLPAAARSHQAELTACLNRAESLVRDATNLTAANQVAVARPRLQEAGKEIARAKSLILAKRKLRDAHTLSAVKEPPQKKEEKTKAEESGKVAKK